MSSSTLTTIFKNLSNLTPLEPPAQDDINLGLYEPLGVHNAHQGPLHNLSGSDADHARSIFLTLHVLFPHELLPALDILDRSLVTKLVVKVLQEEPDRRSTIESKGKEAVTSAEQKDTSCEVFYIQSASAADRTTSSRYQPRYSKASTTSTYYEVRLDSWNCSCPAFSVSTFQSLNLESSSGVENPEEIATQVRGSGAERDQGWEFGGTETLKLGRVPSCKHILAAVLATAAPKLFKDGFKEKIVSKEEVVAYSGGWGELGGG